MQIQGQSTLGCSEVPFGLPGSLIRAPPKFLVLVFVVVVVKTVDLNDHTCRVSVIKLIPIMVQVCCKSLH